MQCTSQVCNDCCTVAYCTRVECSLHVHAQLQTTCQKQYLQRRLDHKLCQALHTLTAGLDVCHSKLSQQVVARHTGLSAQPWASDSQGFHQSSRESLSCLTADRWGRDMLQGRSFPGA